MENSFDKKNIYGTLVIIISAVVFLSYAFSTGITGKTLKNGLGCDCHGASSSDVSVIISGPDSLTVGESAAYTVTITGGELVRGGTNIASSEGALEPLSGDLQIIDGELTHTAPKAPQSNAVSFQFTYTAPNTTGPQTLYANGNSVNFNGTNTGDKWNFASNKIVQVVNVTGIDDDLTDLNYDLKQNFPNPFNPSTRIQFSLAQSGNTEISVYNTAGEKIQNIFAGYLERGNHSVDFNGADLSSGVYYYKMIINNFVSAKKMILIK